MLVTERKKQHLIILYCIIWYINNIHVCTVGQGVHKEGFNFKLAVVKMCSFLPLFSKYALSKEFSCESSDHTVASEPLYDLWKRPKIENLNFAFAMVNMYSHLKGIIIPLKKK